MNVIPIRNYIGKRRAVVLPVSGSTIVDITGIDREWQFFLYLRIFNDVNITVSTDTYPLSPGIYLIALTASTHVIYPIVSLPVFSDEQLTCFDLCYLRRLILEQDPIEAAALCSFECS